MELPLEAVALYALKLAYESEGSSPLLRDDPVMADYEREVFALLVRNGDIGTIQVKVNQCLALALKALGGVDTVMGRELQKLAAGFSNAQTPEQMHPALLTLKDYLKDVQ